MGNEARREMGKEGRGEGKIRNGKKMVGRATCFLLSFRMANVLLSLD